MVTGSLGVWKDEEGAKEAAPLTAGEVHPAIPWCAIDYMP